MDRHAALAAARQLAAELETRAAERSLRAYLKAAWPVLEPGTRFCPGWHLDAICDHGDGVLCGDIRRLLVNIAPRHTKSTVISKALPTYAWIARAGLRFMSASYSGDLSLEHAVHSRQILASPWYQERWGERFTLVGDQNVKSHYANDQRGYRIATSIGGTVTGRGGDILICDDPHNLDTIDSDTVRKGDVKWFREVWSNRLNDPKTGQSIVIAQRGHEDDLSAHLIADGDWTLLVLPTEYTPTPFVTISNYRGWTDPRTAAGELLCPARFGAAENARAKKELGDKYSAQHGQRPTPPGGKMFQRAWFAVLEARPTDIIATCRGWDMAGTEDGGDWTAGVKVSKRASGRFLVEHVVHEQLAASAIDQVMADTARADGRRVSVREEQEPGSSGKAVISAHRRMLAGYDYDGVAATGEKSTRWRPFAVQCRAGNVDLLAGAWVLDFLDEITKVPGAGHDDQVDGCCVAFNEIALKTNELATADVVA